MNKHHEFLAVFLVAVCLQQAQAADNSVPPYEYNYIESKGKSDSKNIAVHPNEAFTVKIVLPEDCTINYIGALKEQESSPKEDSPEQSFAKKSDSTRRTLKEIVNCAELTFSKKTTKFIQIVHEDKYGSYIISIRPPEGKDSVEYFIPKDGNEDTTVPTTAIEPFDKETAYKYLDDHDDLGTIFTAQPSFLVCVIKSTDELISFSGGVGASLLTSKKYTVKTTTVNSSPVYSIKRDDDAEDGFRPFIPAFVHLNVCERGAFTLGIGANPNQFEYLLGVSYRIKRAGYLTVGAHFGQVDALPNGLEKGDTVADGTALSTMRQRQSCNIAVAFSFTFMGKDQSSFGKLIALPTASTDSK